MRFAHFRPDYSTWEGDGPPLELRLARVTPTSAVFEATSTNSPARIEYVLEGPDTLAVTVQGIDTPLRFERVERDRAPSVPPVMTSCLQWCGEP
jgi:hypothetical protein